MNVYPLNDTVAHNQSHLETLSRTLHLSEGEFSLVLVRCNYISLREKIVKQLHQKSTLPIREIHLSPTIDNLYRTLETELAEEDPSVVMVFGLEDVETLDEVLAATNLAREAFLNFPFPVLLWINDKLWKKLNRRAPDFTGYATTYVFLQSSTDLIQFLHSKSQQLFNQILEIGGCSFVSNSKILGEHCAAELQLAYQDLENRKITLKPVLNASLRFVLARYHYAHQNISEALEQYQLSWKFWQEESRTHTSNSSSVLEVEYPLLNSSPLSTALIWQGVILYHLGLCSAYQAEQHLRASGQKEWREARMYFEQCLDYFATAERQDLVGKFINKLGEILRQTEDWDALFKLAVIARKLHQQEKISPFNLAQDYGFFAEYYLHKRDWENTREFATIALEILQQIPNETIEDPLQNQNQGLYYWILAQALEQLSQPWKAIDQLKIAYKETVPKYNPRFYLQILGMLHRLYFDLGEYREAFDIKKEYRTKSSAFGYTAFIGAGRLQPREQAVDPMLGTISTEATVTDEIKASGREEAINRLLQRMGSTQHKLTVIYGQSGVGKSSIIRAGLVPALKNFSIEARQVVTVVLRTYNSYVKELEKQLYTEKSSYFSEEALEEIESQPKNNKNQDQNTEKIYQETLEKISIKLKENANQNKITILIFDQFEEFFFTHTKLPARRQFFEVLRDCLNLPYVKVIISVRDDYLHHLLEAVRAIDFDIINNDILNKDILFYLGNLSRTEAYNVIKSLTNRSHFYLEDALIQAIVNDLSHELGEVRPIELQVVGAQLQAEDITTLADYQRQGPHQKLVERFLEEVIQDCGSENQQAANLILFLLTDENNTRPLKTYSELIEDLKEKIGQEKEVEDQLNLILYILEKSGLVSREMIDGSEFYQLVHDYLADFIQQKNRLDRDAEFEQLQQKNKELKEDIDVYSRLAKEEERRRKAEEHSRQLERITAVLAGCFFVGFSLFAMGQRTQEAGARIEAIQAAKDSLVVADQNDQIGILRAALVIGESIQQTQASQNQENEIARGLRKLFDNSLHERNRLEQQDSILAASYSPDGEIIATAGNEQVIKLWQNNGQFIQDLVDPSLNSPGLSHENNVIGVSFSPDSRLIASASIDRTIKLWSREGELLNTLTGHQSVVRSVNFNPAGTMIASASMDGTIKLWNVQQGTLIKTINAHPEGVLDAKFSPNGDLIASGGLSDPTVKLWKPDGTLLKTFRGHCDSLRQESCVGVYELSFSPDGQTLASASGDRTIRLWNLNTSEAQTLKGHNNDVLGVSFSPDGQTIASSSRDRTVKLWSKEGTILQTFTGHKNDVWTVSFSPDSQMIASASSDNTVKLWDRNSNPLDQTLQGHRLEVKDISFSPNGIIATASSDQTVRLWNTDTAEPLKNLMGEPLIFNHSQEVRWVSISPDGQTLATVNEDQPTVKLWNLEGELLQTLTGHQKPVNALEYSPTGLIASGSQDGTVKLWQDGDLVETLNVQAPVVSIRFDDTGDLMATATSHSNGGSQVQMWSSQDTGWQPRPIFDHPKEISEMSYSPQEELLAIAVDRQVVLWSPSAGTSCPIKHQAIVRSVDFHPNGTLFASASDDQKVRLWQVDRQKFWPSDGNCTDHQEIEAFYTIDQEVFVNSVYFNPDGQIIAIAKEDGTTVLWNMQGFQLDYQIRAGCLWLEDYLQTHSFNPQERVPLCQGTGHGEWQDNRENTKSR